MQCSGDLRTNRREMRAHGGRVIQCLGCGCIGIEFGTSYVALKRGAFQRLAEWVRRMVDGPERPSYGRAGRVRLQMAESVICLSLTAHELRSLRALLDLAEGWLQGGRMPQNSDSFLELHVAAEVIH